MNIIESNLNFKSLTFGNIPNTIILHHAEASHCTVNDIHRWHISRGWSGCGYHFFVKKDGTIYRGRPENTVGAHCLHHNANTIGICAEGSYMTETMPQIQKQAIVQLCKYLKGKYNIKDIKGHEELMATNCPGKNYPLQQIRATVLSPTSTVIQTKANQYGVVTASVLNVREKANVTAKVIGQLKKGTRIRIDKRVGEWYEVYYGQHGGYVSKNFIKLV